MHTWQQHALFFLAAMGFEGGRGPDIPWVDAAAQAAARCNAFWHFETRPHWAANAICCGLSAWVSVERLRAFQAWGLCESQPLSKSWAYPELHEGRCWHDADTRWPARSRKALTKRQENNGDLQWWFMIDILAGPGHTIFKHNLGCMHLGIFWSMVISWPIFSLQTYDWPCSSLGCPWGVHMVAFDSWFCQASNCTLPVAKSSGPTWSSTSGSRQIAFNQILKCKPAAFYACECMGFW